MGHPDPKDGISLDAYLHVICCDHCTETWGEKRITDFGESLLLAAIIGTIGLN